MLFCLLILVAYFHKTIGENMMHVEMSKFVKVLVSMPMSNRRGVTRLNKHEITLATFMAVERIKKEGLLDPRKYTLTEDTVTIVDDYCSVKEMLENVMMWEASLDREEFVKPFVVGAMCDVVCYGLSRVFSVTGRQTPVISTGCRIPEISPFTKPLPNLVRIGGSVFMIVNALFAFLSEFPLWQRVTIVATEDVESVSMANLVRQNFNNFREDGGYFLTLSKFKILPELRDQDELPVNSAWKHRVEEKLFYNESVKFLKGKEGRYIANIFILIMPDCAVVNFMKAAYDLGMMYTDQIRYAFITHSFNHVNVSYCMPNHSDVERALEGLVSINVQRPTKETWGEFETSLRSFRDSYNKRNKNKEQLHLGIDININTALVFDSIYLLARAINATHQRLSKSIWQFQDIQEELLKSRSEDAFPSENSRRAGYYFNFASGSFKTTNRSLWNEETEEWEDTDERDVNYAIEIVQEGRMRVMYQQLDRDAEDQLYCSNRVKLEPNCEARAGLENRRVFKPPYPSVKGKLVLQRGTFRWPGGRISPPDGVPNCVGGWNNPTCTDDLRLSKIFSIIEYHKFLSYNIILLTAIVLLAVANFLSGSKSAREGKISEKKSENEGFKIKWEEIFTPDKEGFDGHNVLAQESKEPAHTTIGLNASNSYASSQDFYTEIGIYKAQVCSIIRINSNINRLNHKNADFLEEVQQMANIRHQNLNLFLGVCLDLPDTCLLYLYNKFGSLADLIREKKFTPTVDNKLSLVLDIAAGMQYLHRTALKFHGHLNSKNCVIDNRWTCKITDYGLHRLQADKVQKVYKNISDALYLAPELLAVEQGQFITTTGTQEGDVYAFGIIVQEIIMWDMPYSIEIKTKPISQIIRHILNSNSRNPFRPTIPPDMCPASWIEITRRCLREKPEDRLTFSVVNLELKRLSKGKMLHIMDVTLEKLEKLNQRLLMLVAKRTEELKQKKNEVESWIFNILPVDIALSLLNNVPVYPEEFEESTIYFSDIVGFNIICQTPNPTIVIKFLNDVFKHFDLVTNRYDLHKCETTKDVYMVVGGVPKKIKHHASEVATMALDMFRNIRRFEVPGTDDNILQLRIGLHSGPVVAGILGTTLPQYCIYGDSVNVASRMQTSGYALRIHISSATAELLMAENAFVLEERGEIPIKGKGTLRTYWLESKIGTNLSVPDPNIAAPFEIHRFK